MTMLLSALWIFIWVFALSKIFSGFIKGTSGSRPAGGSVRKLSDGPSSAAPLTERSGSSSSPAVKKLGKVKSSAREASAVPVSGGPSNLRSMSSMIEDRQNDWLARQLREEEWITKHSKLDLGAAHERECAAEEVKVRRRG